MEIGAIILAAGFGKRFGSDKRLAPLNGKTVVETTVQTYLSVFTSLKVVLRTDDLELADRLPAQAERIFTDQAHLGMGHSLAAAIPGLDWHWAFVGLADMPFIQPLTLQQLVDAAGVTKKTILRPQLGPKLTSSAGDPPHGHPIGFHRTLFPALADLTGDRGARDLLKARFDEIEDIPLADPGILRDIDHATDLHS